MKGKVMSIAVAALVVVAAGVQARVWTNDGGKTLEAELVRVKNGKVFLKLAKNRQIHPLPISSLSEADQEFIKQHEKELVAQAKAEELAKRKAKWLTDYDDAKAESAKFDLPILLLYTAPDWCHYCVVFEENILEEDEFEDYARSNLVLLLADFSKPGDADDWAEDYPQLAKDFPVGGLPGTYLISTSGEKLGKIGGCDSKWSPGDYIGKLEGFKAKAE